MYPRRSSSVVSPLSTHFLQVEQLNYGSNQQILPCLIDRKVYLKLIATYILPRFSFIAVSIFNPQWSCAFMITPSRRIVFIIFTIRPLTPTLTTSVGKSIYLCILIEKLAKLFMCLKGNRTYLFINLYYLSGECLLDRRSSA